MPAGAQPIGNTNSLGGSAVSNSSDAASRMINDMLRRPTQQTGANTLGAQPGGTMGGGIAGVASKLESDSIKIYNEREKYDEWEFVYDFSKDKKRGSGNANQQAGGNTRNASGGPPGGNSSNSFGGNSNSTFGNSNSSFGNSNNSFGHSNNSGNSNSGNSPQPARGAGFGR